jgi:hypothetical protein
LADILATGVPDEILREAELVRNASQPGGGGQFSETFLTFRVASANISRKMPSIASGETSSGFCASL